MKDLQDREVLLFNAALELPGNERISYLEETCRGDTGLLGRITALVEAHERAGAFLQERANRRPAFSTGAAASQGSSDLSALGEEKCGGHVGRYKLLDQIGEGGCGVVYMAEQEEPVRRRVALKVIKLGMDTRQVIARFEAERQALAMMDHPNIAKVFDAGATETGRPYFVMELVRGVKITDYCDQDRLSTEARLRLFIQVCQAIQHAHQKGVIHRDIKPSNILVSANGGLPVPKVIDFGIAKATHGRLTDQTLFTAFEQFIGTPAYMSPEQAALNSLEIDTRSDIYSLGVLLYELLTGQTPFAQKELLAAGLDEMRRTIREREPLPPSMRLRGMAADDLTTVAKHRQSHSQQLIHLVRGDLDWIVMKCLQKDRARRYETVNGLAMDLERHLNYQPVLARPDTLAYRTRKFVRRHRAAVTAAAMILIALLAGLTGTMTQARRATEQARRAETHRLRADGQARAANVQRDFALRQLSRADAINDLNTFLLSDVDPSKAFTVGELLAEAESVVAKETGQTDENRVELLISIGRQYDVLDQRRKSGELLDKAYQLSRRLSEPSIRGKAAAALAATVAVAGECDRAEMLIQEALRELGDAPQHVLYRVFALLRGSRVARECGKEELGVERVQEAKRRLSASGQKSPLLDLSVATNLAEAYRLAGKFSEAADACAAAYQQLSALGRAETEKATTLLNNWALALDSLGRSLEAERLYRKAIDISSSGRTNTESVSPMLLTNYARTLAELNRLDEAAQIAEQAFEKAKRDGDEQIANMALNQRSTIYRKQGNLDRAGEMLAQFEEKTKKLLPPGHRAFAIIASQKALLALARGEMETARTEADRSIAMAEKTAGMRLSFLLLRRAEIHWRSQRYDAARADAARALPLEQEVAGVGGRTSRSGLAHLIIARSFTEQGKRAEARPEYVAALEQLRPCLGDEHPDTREAAGAIADF